MKTKAKTTATETRIQKLNATYQAATPAQRRVMIAKDAIEQIKTERYRPVCGTWASVWTAGGNYPDPGPLQPVLHEKGTQCTCCGVGAIFLSYVRLANKAMVGDGDEYPEIQQTTRWPADNLRLIELAYEEGGGAITANSDREEEAAEFGQNFFDNTKRLIAILNNIVRNNGTFIP